jgi:hypothetical protein
VDRQRKSLKDAPVLAVHRDKSFIIIAKVVRMAFVVVVKIITIITVITIVLNGPCICTSELH